MIYKKLILEHRKQKVVPLHHFLFRMLRFSLFALALIVFSIGIGLFGYHHYAQLSWLDSFHMSCLILTGMGPVAEMTSANAKIFSSFYALYSGIAFLSSSAVFFAPVVHRLMHILQVETDEDPAS
jgi:hypothetical protein